MVDVCLLGSGGMMPLPDRWLTALLFRAGGRMILVDCGEGTQIPLKQAGWGFKAIDAICFTHYHADHVAGLPGLLLTLGNSNRTEPLHLYGPAGLKIVVECLSVICPQLPFPVLLTELPSDRACRFAAGGVQISSQPADHSIPCLAYAFEVARPGRFSKEKAEKAGIPMRLWKALQNGASVSWGGAVYAPETVLGAPRKGIKVGYCTDTRPAAALSGFTQGCDLLVCEGLYGDSALAQRANERGHMVFAQAAAIAKAGGSKELWLTHFSPSVENPEEFIGEAVSVFAHTVIGKSLMKKTLNFEEQPHT